MNHSKVAYVVINALDPGISPTIEAEEQVSAQGRRLRDSFDAVRVNPSKVLPPLLGCITPFDVIDKLADNIFEGTRCCRRGLFC